MIKHVVGDLFTSPDPIILHGCNAQGVMGSGVAKSVKALYPSVYARYAAVCAPHVEAGTTIRLLGTNVIVPGTAYTVINSITQHYYGAGKQVSYDAVDQCFADLARLHGGGNPWNISMPKIGAGLGGGEWSIIESIIAARVPHFNITVHSLPA